MSEPLFADLVASIYQSALDTELWHTTLASVCSALNAHMGVLGFSNVRGRSGVSVLYNSDPEVNRIWLEEFLGEDPWSRAAGHPPTGVVFHGEELVPWDELRRLDVHRAVFSQVDYDTSLCAVLSSTGAACDYLTVARSRKTGPFQQSEGDLMRRLSPHLVRARELHGRLSPLIALGAAWKTVVDRLPYGVVLLDAKGAPRACNAAAERILSDADGLSARRGRLEAATHDATNELHLAIRRSFATSPLRSGSVLALPRRSGLRPYQVFVVPVATPRVRSILGEPVVAILTISDPEAPWTARAQVLERLFELTPALARLAAALVAGGSVAQYAEETGVSEGTVRQQLKELFRRTGTSRQPELVTLILESIAMLAR